MNETQQPEFDVEHLKTYMALSPEQKLAYLEELNRFLDIAMPDESKAIWQRLRTMEHECSGCKQRKQGQQGQQRSGITGSRG